uniref:SFI1 centrin binding protein n=1 Tax=Malurus cyaneus samueli TaxID=2593467 RepID=A0A8C5X6V6_9PASS
SASTLLSRITGVSGLLGRHFGYTMFLKKYIPVQILQYLARKFFYLWAKMTFGQVLPSKARCFYDQKILQKTFGEWKEQWTVCRERKLSLRADNHYRFLHPWYLYARAWRAYAWQQQGKRSKYCVAESHAKKQTMLRTWQRWLVYVDVQKTKHGMQSVALAFRERSCLRTSWAVWRRQHYQKCTGHKMNILALQHWAQSLQFRAWLQWRELYLYTQNEKQKESRAVTHHQHWELRRCMGAWLGYLNLHQLKKRQNDAVISSDTNEPGTEQAMSDFCLFSRAGPRVSPKQDTPEVLLRLAAVMGVHEKNACSPKKPGKTSSKDCLMESLCTLEALYPICV